MCIGSYVNDLTEGEGYLFFENSIPVELIDAINSKLDTLYPVRATSSGKIYAEGDKIKDLPDISYWWSQMVMDWPEVISVNDILLPIISEQLDNAVFYASDIVTINGDTKLVNPHVDTPHRFKRWNTDERLLGVQCIPLKWERPVMYQTVMSRIGISICATTVRTTNIFGIFMNSNTCQRAAY